MQNLQITVRDMSSLDTLRPVTGGVPLAEGAAPQGSRFRLTDAAGDPVPLQAEVIGRWKDGSARWVLLDFSAAPPADGEEACSLTWGQDAGPEPDLSCEAVGDGLRCGDLTLSSDGPGLLSIGDRLDVHLHVLDAEGAACSTEVRSLEVESEGPVRATLQLRGDVVHPERGRWFSFRLRASLYAGLSLLRLEPMVLIDAEKGVMQRIGGLSLQLVPRAEVAGARIGGDPRWEGDAHEGAMLFQRDDQHYRIGGGAEGDRAPGWMEADTADGSVAVAVRDFWQQWPKALEVSDDGLRVGLLPEFEPGEFEHMQPWWKYQYLFDEGAYLLRTGQARRWEVWVDLEGDGETLSGVADRPLIPIADPAQAIATGVWDEIMPAGIPEMKAYDDWAERLFEAFCDSIDDQRDYGVMNWGDWYGERRVNWGNHEYDTTNQLLIQFARTGDPRYFYAADAAARHSTEVDTVHHVNDDLSDHFCETSGGPKRGEEGEEPAYPYRAGMVHQHTVGHVSGFFSVATIRELFLEHEVGRPPNPYLCLQPTNLGHIWTQGTMRHHFLTGDPFIRETVLTIGENLARLVEDRRFQFMGHSHCGRVTGWSMLALGGAYEIELDERYLDAMRTLAEDAMADQDPNCGGWLYYPMAPGHCNCETERHTGMAGFITAVLINGLSRYYQLSGDERLPESIDAAVTFLDLDTWHEHPRGWRYTSCPGTALRGVNQPGVTMMAHVNGARFGNSLEHLRILRLAWEEKFRRLLEDMPRGPGFGKSWTSTMYGCAETASILARHPEG
ncbi:MAG: hypothetical protein U9R79_10865 [Armatimonadota bacterium]|nr:hypothetical protein [Armatimonadota bacterium]